VTAKPSLRLRLVRHVLVPLVATWALGTSIAVLIAHHFAVRAFDRALLDDAYDVATHVQASGDQLTVSLTAEEMSAILFDQSEKQYFAVLRPDGTLIAGQAGLPAAHVAAAGEHEFEDGAFEGHVVRAVSLRSDRPKPYIVVMAQTTASRQQLLEQLLLYSAAPQAALLALLAWWLRRRIRDDLDPLAQLQEAIGSRHGADLAPLPRTLQDASTREVERIAQAIDSLFVRLQESLQAQREFAGTVAHELRTPLAGIRAQAAFALAHDDASVWREQLEGIAHAEQRASRLVDQLLALARADEGRVSLAMETLDLAGLAREVVLRWVPQAHPLGVDLGAEGLEEPVFVRGDRAMLEGILNNLLDNALRYGTGDPEPRITVALKRLAQGVELSVRDNGKGLTPADINQLKKRWVRGAPGRHVGEGAGLGLAIVVRYADLLGARLELSNIAEGGLRAQIEFSQSQEAAQ
jgi:two-component system sensor histidine kinase TctE